MPDTSITLLDRLRSQPDEETWKRFVDLYAPLIRGWLRRYSVAEQDAEDLTQEVMTVMIRQFPSFEHNQHSGAFRNWLRTVTVNQLRVLWRTRRNSCATGDSAVARMLDQLADPESSLSKLWDQQHDQHVAAKLMELIRPQFEATTWQAFRRVALDGMKAAIVAQELGISVNAVLLAKSRVLSRLRQELRGLTD
jgi:RNA polymerase sigma-70 factor (ECF subfamily)